MKRLAVIIPYRHRQTHLRILAPILHTALQRNSVFFPSSDPFLHQIFVIEQANDKPFNRGKLENIGFALAKDKFDYFCFHDVDLIPIRSDYSYVLMPTHLSADVSQFKDWVGKGLAYPTCFGGVALFNKEDFVKVNGFSNEYWGYGLEDDDLLARVVRNDLKWARRQGIYASIPHPLSSGGELHAKNQEHYLNIINHQKQDLSGLSTLDFVVKNKHEQAHYIFYSVDI